MLCIAAALALYSPAAIAMDMKPDEVRAAIEQRKKADQEAANPQPSTPIEVDRTPMGVCPRGSIMTAAGCRR